MLGQLPLVKNLLPDKSPWSEDLMDFTFSNRGEMSGALASFQFRTTSRCHSAITLLLFRSIEKGFRKLISFFGYNLVPLTWTIAQLP